MKNIVEFAASAAGDSVGLNDHTDADWDILNAVKDTTVPWGNDIAHAIAERLWGNAETAKFMDKLNRDDQEMALAVWYEKLASGRPGEAFWAETCLIGLYHAGAGVHNRHVVTMTSLVENIFLTRCFESFEKDQALEIYGAFKRIFGLCTALMVDTYHQAVMLGMEDIGMNERLVGRMRSVAIRQMIDQARQALPLMDWSDALSVGVQSIDDQHRKLIDLLNSLRDAAGGVEGDNKVKAILAELTQYTVDHFGFEEEIFDRLGYPDTAAHKEAHVNLVRQVSEINDQFQAGKGKLGGDLFKFLRSWLNGHIRGTDKKYTAFFHEHNVD